MKELVPNNVIQSIPDGQYQIIIRNGDDILMYQVDEDETPLKKEVLETDEIIYDDNLTYNVEYTIKEENTNDEVNDQDHDYVSGVPNESQQTVWEEGPSNSVQTVEVQKLPDQEFVYFVPYGNSMEEYVVDTPCIRIKESEMATEELLREHLESQHGEELEGMYQCNKCFRILPDKKSFRQHRRTVHSKLEVMSKEERNKYKENYRKVCETCGKGYHSRTALNYHQRVHTGERPYRCTICEKTFTMPLFLQIHIRTHTGERPYQCSRCPKAFSNQAALMRHDRVHTGVKPYPCPRCGKCFTQSNSMKLHVRTVHMKLPAPYKRTKRRAKTEPVVDQCE